VSDPEREDEDNALARRSKALFDASVSGLDAHVRSRLTQARHAAVEAREHKRRPWFSYVRLPVVGVATVALAVCIGIAMDFMSSRGDGQPLSAALAADDLALLADADNLDLIEDMEFYAWLDTDAGDNEPAEPIGATQDAAPATASSQS